MKPTMEFVSTRVTVALVFVARLPKEHVTTPPALEQVPTVVVADPSVVPAGRGSVNTTARAVADPALVTRIVFVRALPAKTGSGAPPWLIFRPVTGRVTVITALAVLLPGLGSVSAGHTLAVFVRRILLIPEGRTEGDGTATMATVATAPVVKVPRLARTVLPFVRTTPCDGVAETNIRPVGTILVKAMELAVLGPPLATVKV
jgi:hypothetical protein